MIRLLVEFLLPLLAPTLIYALWLAWEKRRIDAGAADADADSSEGAAAPRMRDAPWMWLGGIGLVCVIVVAATLSMTRSLGDVAGGNYVPPRNVDGRVVPGHLEPPKK
jgi:hypothetical protein